MASVSDKVTDTRNAGRPNSARVSSTRSAGAATLSCDNLTGWPTASKVHFVTYSIDSNGDPVSGTQLDCYGIVSSNSITSMTVVDGSDNGNTVGDVVEMLPTAAWGQDLAEALIAAHNRDGTPKSGITYPASTFTTPTISDFTSAGHTHASTAQGGQLTSTAFADGGLSTAKLTNPYEFFVYRSSAQAIAAGSTQKVQFEQEVYDTGSNYDNATNYRWVTPATGLYRFSAAVNIATGGTETYWASLFKNGTEYIRGQVLQAAGSATLTCTVNPPPISCSTNDYFEIYMTNSSGGIKSLSTGASPILTFFGGELTSKT